MFQNDLLAMANNEVCIICCRAVNLAHKLALVMLSRPLTLAFPTSNKCNY